MNKNYSVIGSQFWTNIQLCLDLIFCSADEDKLKWAFRLYDMDNNGVIDMDEMAAIIETLDCIEGVKPGWQTYFEGNGTGDP